MNFTKHTIALTFLDVISKQKFADFYNGPFEDFISSVKEVKASKEAYAQREEIVAMIEKML